MRRWNAGKGMRFVIGRISDLDMENARRPHWTMVRDLRKEHP